MGSEGKVAAVTGGGSGLGVRRNRPAHRRRLAVRARHQRARHRAHGPGLPPARAGPRRWRRILLTASSSVLARGVRMAAYQTTKSAVMGFGETVRERCRPAALGRTGAQADDLDAMLAHRPLAEGDVVMPEHAVRNVLADLRADEPYSLTHGSHRPVYEQRRAAMDAAFDRMEAS